MKSDEIEIAVAHWYGTRKHVIVPNVSWGMFQYELDMVVLTPSDYLHEIEIKVSKSDLVRDKEKWHGHRNNLVRELYFAIPIDLIAAINHIPERAGVFTVRNENGTYRVNLERKAIPNKLARKLTEKEKFNLARLGALRIWALKESIISRRTYSEKSNKVENMPHV